MQKAAVRTKSLEKLEKSLSKQRTNSMSQMETYQTSLVRYTSDYYRGKANPIDTPKNSEKRVQKDLSKYLTPKNNSNLGQVKNTFKKAKEL